MNVIPRRHVQRECLLWLLVWVFLANLAFSSSCGAQSQKRPDSFAALRQAMVKNQLAARDIRNRRVLKAMAETPRHEFVPERLRGLAYEDSPLPIGEDQTISQPYIVALMTELIDPRGDQRVLEIGTGSGYQAAVLAGLVEEVFTIEIVPELAERARSTLARLGYKNVHVRTGDGYGGWPAEAPFDAVLVTAAAGKVPQPLLDQLRVGGKLVMPVGEVDQVQTLTVITRTKSGFRQEEILPVRFVPLTGPLAK
jgi:protein-L-isoaspartate(D-aspartate) O-methyltransferase